MKASSKIMISGIIAAFLAVLISASLAEFQKDFLDEGLAAATQPPKPWETPGAGSPAGIGSGCPGDPEGSFNMSFWTDCDNANNAGQRISDNDMDTTVLNSMSKHPIEFYIDITTTGTGLLQISAFDVESETGECGYPEVDEVYINDNFLGRLKRAI